MLVLAIDTAHKNGSFTLARGNAADFEVIATHFVDGGTFSAQLVPQISATLREHRLDKSEIQGFAAAHGPGSFTGLRIGLAAVKGLAEVLNKPIAAVSVLEAIAASSKLKGSVLSLMDAGRSEVYAGEYQATSLGAQKQKEFLCTNQELLELLRSNPAMQAVTPDKKIAELLSCAVIDQPDSRAIAQLGLAKLLSGETVPVEALDANYVRRDDNLFARQS